MQRRVQTATKLRASTEVLGELRVRLLECCVVRDLSWREIAIRPRLSDQTETMWVAEAITALAD